MVKKTALITGASRRIGLAFAHHLAKKRWNLALHYNTSNTQINILKKELELEYPNARFEIFACNLKEGEEVSKLISQVIKHFGIFDLLINNASVFNSGLIRQSSQELFDNQIEIKSNYYLRWAA